MFKVGDRAVINLSRAGIGEICTITSIRKIGFLYLNMVLDFEIENNDKTHPTERGWVYSDSLNPISIKWLWVRFRNTHV